MRRGFVSLCLFVVGLMLISGGAVVSVQPTLAAPLADITETVTEPPPPTTPVTPTDTATPTDTPPVETVISNVTPAPPGPETTPTPTSTPDLTITPTPTPIVVLDTTGSPSGGLHPVGLAMIALGCLFIVLSVTLSVRKSARRS